MVLPTSSAIRLAPSCKRMRVISAGSRDLIVVCLRDGLVLAASDEHKRCLVLPQKFDAGIIRHGVGQDHAVHLVVGQLPLQL